MCDDTTVGTTCPCATGAHEWLRGERRESLRGTADNSPADSSLGNRVDCQWRSPGGTAEERSTTALSSLRDYGFGRRNRSPGMNPLGYCRVVPVGDYCTAIQDRSNRSCTRKAQALNRDEPRHGDSGRGSLPGGCHILHLAYPAISAMDYAGKLSYTYSTRVNRSGRRHSRDLGKSVGHALPPPQGNDARMPGCLMIPGLDRDVHVQHRGPRPGAHSNPCRGGLRERGPLAAFPTRRAIWRWLPVAGRRALWARSRRIGGCAARGCRGRRCGGRGGRGRGRR